MKKVFLSLIVVLSLVLSIAGAVYAAPSPKPKTIDVYDGESIQDVINYANQGDTIIVHPGIYPEEVTITKPLILKGEGASIITPGGSGIDIEALATVSGFTIEPADNGIIHYHGIHLGNFYFGAVVENNEISSGFIYDGIVNDSPSGTVIRNNNVISELNGYITKEDGNQAPVYVGIRVNGGEDISIIGNSLNIDDAITDESGTLISSFAMSLGGCDGIMVANNAISATTNYGITLGPLTGAVVTENDITVNNQEGMNDPHGIHLGEVTNSVVSNNIVHGGYRGIGAMWCDDIVLNGNSIFPNEVDGSEGGIWFSDTANSTIKNNLVYGDFPEGMVIANGSNANAISNNNITLTFTGGGSHGIWLGAGATGNVVKNNTVSGAGDGFVAIDDSDGLNIIKY